MFNNVRLSTLVEAAIFSLTIAVCLILYWGFYVKPADEVRYCVISCMQGDNSYDKYEECVTGIRVGTIVCEE